MAAGGAATSLPVLHFFEDIGIPICEGYGLTETSPIITCGKYLLIYCCMACSAGLTKFYSSFPLQAAFLGRTGAWAAWACPSRE